MRLNHKHWPGVAEGDLICIASPLPDRAPGFLFVVPPEDPSLKHQLQVSFLVLHSRRRVPHCRCEDFSP